MSRSSGTTPARPRGRGTRLYSEQTAMHPTSNPNSESRMAHATLPKQPQFTDLAMGMTKTVLVTGGAGDIGSHACKALARAGYKPVVYDNLSRGHRAAVRWGPLVEG